MPTLQQLHPEVAFSPFLLQLSPPRDPSMNTAARIPSEGGREKSILEWLRRTDVCLLLDNGMVGVDQSQFTTKHMPSAISDPRSAVVSKPV